MIPHITNAGSITFFAYGVPYVIAHDHPNFATVRELLASGSDDEDLAVRLADVTVAVKEATDGRGELTEEGLIIDGTMMPAAWNRVAVETPEETRVLLVSVGDLVRVEGDEDAPDGVYTVGDVDNDDTSKRVMVESDEGFFGFVANAAIKEVVAPL
jgi:hypothetical protein